MLPVSPFTETSGTYVNAQGLPQSFKGTVAPFGQTRPGWKVLRVLGNVCIWPASTTRPPESVRDTVLAGGVENRLSNAIKAQPGLGQVLGGLERVADVPIIAATPWCAVRAAAGRAGTRSSPPRA